MDEKKFQRKLEFYQRADEAHRFAEETRDPAEKVDFFAVERRWLSLARGADEKSDRS
jgi:hypothetical protein